MTDARANFAAAAGLLIAMAVATIGTIRQADTAEAPPASLLQRVEDGFLHMAGRGSGRQDR
ncbi:MAG: hypothetical protein ACQGVC_14680 [Myxococcota bacterium]